jgi:hypothetical protein
MREDGVTTFEVSDSECTAACGDAAAAVFQIASQNGSTAFFISAAKLTDSSSPDDIKLYRWNRNAPEGSRLVDLTFDDESADGTEPGARGIVGISTDAEVVYFVATGQIVAGGPIFSGMKLYRWRWNSGSPSVDYLAPYVSVTTGGFFVSSLIFLREGDDPNVNREHLRATPDGEHLMITSPVALDATSDSDSDVDAYRWTQTSGWTCLSCQQPSIPSAGEVNHVWSLMHGGAEVTSLEPEHSISDDGRRVYFLTRDALLPEDVNGEEECPIVQVTNSRGTAYACQDIYLWQAPGDGECTVQSANYFARNGGCISLISTGEGIGPEVLAGATAAGDRIFFESTQRLVGHDTDDATDLYTARVDGGFPEPEPEPPCDLSAVSCEGPGTESPEPAGAATSQIEGPGDIDKPFPRDCSPAANRARKLDKAAKSLRRAAEHASNPKQAGKLRRRAAKLSSKAQKARRGAKRCRRANREVAS